MELIFVREFAVLAETCNFQIAADSLSMSQSALSKHIQKLEEELNVQLFDRSKKTVTLNENGQIFLKYARELCRTYDECERALAAKKSIIKNSLNISFIRILGQYDLMEQLTDYSVLHPEIQVSIFETNGDQIKARLSSGECDFIFTAKADEIDRKEYEVMFYCEDHITVVMPKGHHLAGRDIISINDLRNEKFIEHNTSLEHKIFKDLCRDYDLEPNIVASVTSSSTVLHMISEGIGISVMSSGCSDQYANYDLVRAELEPKTAFNIYLVYRRRKLSATDKEFINFFTS